MNLRWLLPIVLLLQGQIEIRAQEGKGRVQQRRSNIHIICHRGSSEFAHENTLEGFRATFELGADGNEIDIRATKDGVLVCFHDDMLDRLLEAFGDVGDYTWEELQRFAFREPQQFGDQCRIPTLEEVLQLHKQYDGLVHLDIKRPNLDKSIAALLDRLNMWDHVAYCNLDHGGVLLKDPRLKLCQYKSGLYLDRGEVFPAAIADAIKKPGEGLIVDDPRGAIVALGRKLGKVSKTPVSPKVRQPLETVPQTEQQIVDALKNDRDWNQAAESHEDRAASGNRILARARAAEQARQLNLATPPVFDSLENRVRHRSLHKDWQFHGLDGAISLRSYITLGGPHAEELARFVLWRDDEALEAVANPMYKYPRAWTDFRIKMLVFPILAQRPSPAADKICRDYLALSDEAAHRLGPAQFDEAARCLLTISAKKETALELMQHRLQVVRGRAILDCLAHAGELWARESLSSAAPHAMEFMISDL